MDYREEFCEIWTREVTRPGADKLLEWLGTTDFFPRACLHTLSRRLRERPCDAQPQRIPRPDGPLF